MKDDDLIVSPEILLRAYAAGVFPMAESADDPGLHWVEPRLRGIIPLDGFHLSQRLARLVKSGRHDVTIDEDFAAVIDACAAPRAKSRETWINRPIRALYGRLFELGHCHTVEVRIDGRLVGGLYGIALGGAFFGESMFHHERDCSKLALIHLVARLRAGGFRLLDTQFVTEHLKQFGAVEVPQKAYRKLLAAAIETPATFHPWPGRHSPGADVVLAALGQAPTG